MKTDRVKQIICISETNSEIFESRMNEALSHLVDPEIQLDSNRSFTAYIIYNVKKDVPEDIVEEHELEGECLHCIDCPLCDRVVDIYGNIDSRVKWGKCMKNGMISVNLNKRVCADYWENEERK